MTLLAREPRAPFALAAPVLPLQRRARGYDWMLIATALVLSLAGAALVWAATRDASRAQGANPQAFLYRHLFNLAVAAVLMVLASRLDARLLRLFGPVVYVLSLLGLVAVVFAGSTVNGAHAWIRFGTGVELQPSEFMKLGLIVGMAVLFAQRGSERRSRSECVPERRSRSECEPGRTDDASPTTTDVLMAMALVAVPLAMVMMQPDLGSAMVLAAAAFGVLIAAGVRARWTIGLLAFTVVVAVLAVKGGLLADYQLARFSSFTHPGNDTQGAAYNVTQAHIAIANGGLFGTGLFHGPQTNGGFVPEQRTDFVFSVVGEEWGLFGGAGMIGLYALLCWRGLRIAAGADRAGRLVAVGIVCWIAFQAFQNIGMNLGLTPVTGLPLPFVSYGGSSMFAQGLAIGLLQAVRRSSR
ncbi:MAG: rod shape-determining protein RodA [Pseudonocardiales bacterium]|nr:MAG: rod shape-determining protein RodA [Pseudonocardiales bacterium]